MNNQTRFTSFLIRLVALICLTFPADPGFAATSDVPPTDRFGGNLTLVTRLTGHFRVEQSRGRWWLVTPEGHGRVAMGVNHLSEMKNTAVHSRTVLAQRFGQDWPRVFAEVERQCRAWGFNCAGFQTPVEMRDTMPYVISTSFMSVSFWQNPLAYKPGLLRPDSTPFEDYVERIQETNWHILNSIR